MDPIDFFLYDEFLNPDMKYECQNCGALFGNEDVIWDEETHSHVAVCPACGNHTLADDVS
jgi:DNA-directed RNA polymerase subunit RPC12/RpoP